jgi:hypothetical protein
VYISGIGSGGHIETVAAVLDLLSPLIEPPARLVELIGAARTAGPPAIEVTGAKVARFAQRELGEALSGFPLTVVVQRIAVELTEPRGVSPDRFRYEEDRAARQPSRRSASRRPRTSSRASAVPPIAHRPSRATMRA